MGELLQYFMPFAWILIPLAGIAVGAFKEWLKFKDKQARLGASNDELVKEVKALKASIADKDKEMTQRLQNLETIVTSQVWDTIHTDEKNLPHLMDEIREPEPEEISDSSKAAEIAKRLKS